jgi:hypothetical protein
MKTGSGLPNAKLHPVRLDQKAFNFYHIDLLRWSGFDLPQKSLLRIHGKKAMAAQTWKVSPGETFQVCVVKDET